MFDYEKYINELSKIEEDEMENWSEDIENIDEYEQPFITIHKPNNIN